MTNPTTQDLLAILRANPHPKQTYLKRKDHVAYINIDGREISYDGQWCSDRIGFTDAQFKSLDPKDVHTEIDRVLNIAKQTHTETQTMTTDPCWEEIKAEWDEVKTDCVDPDLPTEQTFVSIDRYRELEAELKTVKSERDEAQKRIAFLESELSDAGARLSNAGRSVDELMDERDRYKSSYDYAQNLLNQIWDATGWLEKVDNNPCAIEYIKRLKSKADRAGLLSVVCRRLCGDENASIETVHAAIDRCHDEATTIEFIGERLGIDPDGMDVTHLGEIRSLVAQLVKSLGDKTVSLEQTKQSLEWFTQEVEKLRFERDAERVGNKRLTETIEDLKRTTVKLPNEHTLRRLFNRHNTPDKYRDGTSISTIERLLLLIEHLESQVSVQTRRAEHMVLVNHQHETTISDTRAILDERGVPSYAGDIYLSLSARIRSLFTTKV